MVELFQLLYAMWDWYSVHQFNSFTEGCKYPPRPPPPHTLTQKRISGAGFFSCFKPWLFSEKWQAFLHRCPGHFSRGAFSLRKMVALDKARISWCELCVYTGLDFPLSVFEGLILQSEGLFLWKQQQQHICGQRERLSGQPPSCSQAGFA